MTLAALAATAAADTGSPIRELIQSERGISLVLGFYKVQALKILAQCRGEIRSLSNQCNKVPSKTTENNRGAILHKAHI